MEDLREEPVPETRQWGPLRVRAARLAEEALGIRSGEGRQTALLYAFLFSASAIFVLGRTVRDTLFLSRYPVSALPWMFVLFGVVSALVAVLYGAVADRIPRRGQIWATLAVGAATYLAVWVFVRRGAEWVYPAFYIWTDVVANLLVMQFWTLANDLHDARAAKRLFGTIGSARILGVIVCGLAAGAAVTAIGTTQLILVLVLFMGAIAGIVGLLGVAPGGAGRVRKPPKGRPAAPGVLTNPYVRSLAGAILLVFVALTIGDYQFKIAARQAFREDDLARFFSLFYAGAGAVGFLFQIVLTPRILRRLGVLAGMLVMPLSVFASSAAFFLFGGLSFASVLKFADNGLQFTIHETSLQVLYVPFPEAMKARARALLDTAVKPLSYGLGGLALVLLAERLPVRGLSLLTLPVTLFWVALLPGIRKRYIQALEASLSGRAGAFDVDRDTVQDSEARKLILRSLQSPDPSLVLHALERLKDDGDAEVRNALVALAANPDARVRRQAVHRMGETGKPEYREAVRSALDDPETKVRAAALEAFCSIEGDESVEEAEGQLRHPDGSVRAAAIVGLILHGGIEGAVVGGARLEALLGDPDPKRRIEAAEILYRLGRPGYRPLRRLLQDGEARVRKAALKAASSVADPRLLPLLLEALGAEGSRKRAARALAAVGPLAFDPLLAALRDPDRPREVKLLIPRILKQIPSREHFAALLHPPLPPDGQVRLRLYSCAGTLRHSLGLPPRPAAEVLALAQREIAEAGALAAAWESARPRFGTPLLQDSVELSLRRAMHRVFRLLELRFAKKELDMVWRALRGKGRTATALEILDTLLDPALKGSVLPFVEGLSAGGHPAPAPGLAPPLDPVEFLVRRCDHANPYTAFVALVTAAERGEPGALDAARRALHRSEPLAREGGLKGLATLGSREDASRFASECLADPDPLVAALAAGIVTGGEIPMYSTVEKVLFLMSVPIFSGLPGEDLAPLARVAEVESVPEGTRIFREGDEGEALYVVMRGQVSILKRGLQLALLGPKECFGEMSVLDAVPRSADAVATVETEVLRISSEAFYDILHEQTEIAEGVIRILTRRLRDSEEKRAGGHVDGE